MRKIQYNIFEHDSKTASIKAKSDVTQILHKYGFDNLYKPSRYRAIRIIQQFLAIILLPKKCEFFIQYHSNISFFYKLLSCFKSIRKIAVIHDLESLRGLISQEEEAQLLNGFDVIISHNAKMTEFLKSIGVHSEIYDLNIFDYLLDDKMCVNDNYDQKTIFFAGNLTKSKFLGNLHEVKDVKFNLYGPCLGDLEKIKQQENVSYKGSFSPNELITNIEGGWGLVWDGDTIETCSGIVGEYLKFNNPHKVSMCIVSERPIIIWKKSAMAEYIQSNGLGVAIDSLLDIPGVLSGISDADYNNMLGNVRKEKELLSKGRKLGSILEKMEV